MKTIPVLVCVSIVAHHLLNWSTDGETRPDDELDNSVVDSALAVAIIVAVNCAFAAMVPIWREEAARLRETTLADLANEGVSWNWVDAGGPAALALLRESALNDLVVVGGAFGSGLDDVLGNGANDRLRVNENRDVHVAPFFSSSSSSPGPERHL